MIRRIILVLTIGLACSFAFVPPGRGESASATRAHKHRKGKKAPAVKRKAAKRKTAHRKTHRKERSVAAVKRGAPEKVVPAEEVLVKGLRYWSNPDYTRFAISVSHEVKFDYHHIPADRERGTPPRLYIDLKGARIAPGVKDVPIGDGLLKTARIAQYSKDTVRVVLDLDSIRDYKVFTFSDPFRVIVDVRGERREEIRKPQESALAPLPPPPVVPVPTPAVKVEEGKKPESAVPGKIRRIVIDPGHGGHDPGASGPDGVREKDVVLQIGLKLAKLCREKLGLDVVMTRSTDVFIELQERTAIANKVGADLFVSIHANAALNRNMSGIETYYLNLAKTEKVAQLAAQENGTSLEKVSLLQAVLFDLMANYKLNDSAHLAEDVQKALYRKISGAHSGVKNLGVKQGPFYVLVGASMPSILVETAFVSNEREEARLNDPRYQEETAEGIMEGIRAYIDSLK